MFAFSGYDVLKIYHVSLGEAADGGPKQYENDNKTPEGSYKLDFKVTDSSYYKALHISYPDVEDLLRRHPGGMIMLHGFPNANVLDPRDYQLPTLQRRKLLVRAQRTHESLNAHWTEGCVGVTNSEIDEIFANLTGFYNNLEERKVSSGALPVIDLCP